MYHATVVVLIGCSFTSKCTSIVVIVVVFIFVAFSFLLLVVVVVTLLLSRMRIYKSIVYS